MLSNHILHHPVKLHISCAGISTYEIHQSQTSTSDDANTFLMTVRIAEKKDIAHACVLEATFSLLYT